MGDCAKHGSLKPQRAKTWGRGEGREGEEGGRGGKGERGELVKGQHLAMQWNTHSLGKEQVHSRVPWVGNLTEGARNLMFM